MTSRPSQQRFGVRGLAAVLSLFALGAPVHALQTVTPATAGGTALTGIVPVAEGSTFTFFGMYTDDSSGVSESGLGLKVKYNGLHLTNVSVTEEYTKCRIAAAQYPASNAPPTAPTAADQVVMGWIDTSIRTAGAVGWPDLADTTAGGASTPCLNPGGINNAADTAAGVSLAPGQKLFKFTATVATGCNTAACSSNVTLDSDLNFSYANAAGAGYTVKSFTINGAAAPTLTLAAANPFVSRKTHGSSGTFDLVLTPSTSVANGTQGSVTTVEPRQSQSGTHQIVIAFSAGVSAAQFPTVSAVAGTTTLPTSTSFSGNEMIVSVGNAGTPVPNGVRVLVSAAGVGTAAGVNPSVAVAFLEGDVTNTTTVNGSDILAVRLASGQAVSATTFLNDVTVSGGFINGSDILAVRLKSGVNLP